MISLNAETVRFAASELLPARTVELALVWLHKPAFIDGHRLGHTDEYIGYYSIVVEHDRLPPFGQFEFWHQDTPVTDTKKPWVYFVFYDVHWEHENGKLSGRAYYGYDWGYAAEAGNSDVSFRPKRR